MEALTRLLLFELLLVSLLLKANCEDPRVLLGHGGTVEGKTIQIDVNNQMKSVNQYLGIPYAEPPTSWKRFAKPIKHPGWRGVKEAKNPPNSCWQFEPGSFDVNNTGARMWFPNTNMSEDCLYLNVWAPEQPEGNRVNMPVMVWIYGGGFFSGSSTLDVYNGSILAATQNVVVVSMQYRVGAFGFLRVPVDVLGMDMDALGNEGLHDQAMALQWVKDNIEYFKGDKGSITLFGESAGAVSVSAHWLSPISRGLFQRAIMESASIYARWAYFTKEEAHERAKAFIKGCGCETTEFRDTILLCLRKVKEKDLVGNLSKIYELVNSKRNETMRKHMFYSYTKMEKSGIPIGMYFDAPLRPVVDGIFLPKEPDELMKERAQIPGPELLIGVNRNEGMYFLLYGLKLNDTTFLLDNGTVNLPKSLTKSQQKGDLLLASMAQFIDTEYLKYPPLAETPAYFYGLTNKNESASAKSLMKQMDAYTGDLDFICPTLKFANKVSQIPQAKVFFYSFERRTENFTMPRWVGVMHGYEIEYVFGMPRSEKFQNTFYRFNDKEKRISDLVMKLWANFARVGNPITQVSDFHTEWPPYDPSNPEGASYFVFGNQMTVLENLKKRECLFWEKEMPKYYEYMKNHINDQQKSGVYIPRSNTTTATTTGTTSVTKSFQ